MRDLELMDWLLIAAIILSLGGLAYIWYAT